MKINNEILKILDNCTVKENVVFLPQVQLDRKTYLEVNKCLESIGGKWNRKAKGHLFEENPEDLLDNLVLTGETVDLKKEYQYFPTPSSMAKQMIEMAEINENDVLLEPSAGQGAIVDEMPKSNTKIIIELNEGNAKVLKNKGYEVVVADFLSINSIAADKAIMNPPFTKQQDVEHIMHAYNLLNQDGILVSVVSESPFFRDNKKSVDFREFLENNNAEIFDNEPGAFKESGTMVKTRIIKLRKVRG